MRTLIKHQWTLLWRTQRLFILFGLGAFVGLLSAITARFLPEILAFALALDGLEGIPLPEATITEAYAQFMGNISQLFMMVLLFIFASYVHFEARSGFDETFYTFPFSAFEHLFAKTFVMFGVLFMSVYWSALWFGSYALGLFGEMAWIELLFAMMVVVSLFYLFYAITLLAYTLTRRFSLTLLITFTLYFALITLTMFESTRFHFLPQALFQAPMQVFIGSRSLLSAFGLSFLYLLVSDGLILLSIRKTHLGPKGS